ncbi:hypothetical protein PVL29_015477 [Vitis rotundifolia]|uniref:Uncharacterized protein n=1 Tax=Vitis rotundifolia TaxID=103349 RepID=A0AA39DJT9_VITRO|nr:hypothetical protein PVL29_015477 [Vitis rotundifolia]
MLTKQPISGTDNFGFRRNYWPHCNKKVIVASVFAFDPSVFSLTLKKTQASTALITTQETKHLHKQVSAIQDSKLPRKSSKPANQNPRNSMKTPQFTRYMDENPPEFKEKFGFFFFFFSPPFQQKPMVSGKKIVSSL